MRLFFGVLCFFCLCSVSATEIVYSCKEKVLNAQGIYKDFLDIKTFSKIVNLIIEKKIKGINSTNQKITIMLLDKLKSDLKSKDIIKNDIKSKISKCDDEIFYLYNIASDMWYLAGDKSTDYNFYTKRLILTGILSKLYFKILALKDYSLEQLEIDIKGEIKNVGKFNKLKSKIISTFQNLKDRPFSKNTGRGY